jgi:hypothetical protein
MYLLCAFVFLKAADDEFSFKIDSPVRFALDSSDSDQEEMQGGFLTSISVADQAVYEQKGQESLLFEPEQEQVDRAHKRQRSLQEQRSQSVPSYMPLPSQASDEDVYARISRLTNVLAYVRESNSLLYRQVEQMAAEVARIKNEKKRDEGQNRDNV